LEAAEKAIYFVIPSEARNLSSFSWSKIEERFLASLGMTKGVGPISGSQFNLLHFETIQKSKPDRLKPVLLSHYAGKGLPLVSSPKGTSARPTTRASAIIDTGIPNVW
jgi:hypothetical protein